MAEQVGAVTRFPSLPFMFGSDNLSLSWTRSGSMIPPICSAVKHYQQHFAEDSVEGRAAAVLRHKEDRSLLDGLHAQYKRLQQNVSAADRDRLEQFAVAVRDAEKRLAAAEGWLGEATSRKPPCRILRKSRRGTTRLIDGVGKRFISGAPVESTHP